MQSVDFRSNSRKELAALATIGILICFILGFLITHEVSLEDSLKLCAILALDLITGVIIWVLLSQKNEYSVFELFGVGVALGTSLNAIGQLVFRETYFSSLFNYALLSLVVIIFIQWRRKNLFTMRLSPTCHSTVLAVCSTALVLLCSDRYYLWAGVLILFLATFASAKSERNSSNYKSQYLYIVLSVGSIALALFSASVLEKAIFGSRSTTSYINGWDGVYAEASSKSITLYGPFDNILMANNKTAYQWFADAWSGAITQRSNVSDWVVTTQFGFIVSAITIISLAITVLTQLVPKQLLTPMLLIPIITTSLVGQPHNLLYLPSFSQVIGVLLTFFLIFLLGNFIKYKRRSDCLLIVLLGPLLLLTKTTIAVPALLGVVVGTTLVLVRGLSFKKNTGLLSTVLLTLPMSIATYLLFIRPSTTQNGRYSEFEISLNQHIFGIFSVNIWLSVVILLLLPCAVAFLLGSNSLWSNELTIYLVSISVVSLIFSLMLNFWITQASIYMLVPFFIAFPLLTVRVVAIKWPLAGIGYKKFRTLASILVVISAASGMFATIRLHYLNFNFIIGQGPIFITGIFPIFCAVVLIVVFSASSNSLMPDFKSRSLIFVVLLLAQTAGFYVGHSFRSPIGEFVSSQNQWDLAIEDVETQIVRLKSATSFLASELEPQDLLASNSITDRGLLAALTGIRNYGNSYWPNLWGGNEQRYLKQKFFVEYPQNSIYEGLRNDCVTWFYYDKKDAPGKPKTFEPYATTMYEDEFGAVLKLSESYPLPEECLD